MKSVGNGNKKILIVGDIMLDAYHYGKVDRISPEAPVPVFLEIGDERYVPGGAANVAVNVAAIGIETVICSVVGEDDNGKRLLSLLKEKNVVSDYVLVDKNRITTCKLRYIGPNNQQIMRADYEKIELMKDSFLDEIYINIEKSISKFGLILISDYCKGFLSESITQRFIQLGIKAEIPVVIDVKDSNLKKYNGATLLKPNRKELSVLSGMDTSTREKAIEAAIFLCKITDTNFVLTTLGYEGMILVDENGLVESVKSTTREVYDVTGAGDTSIAYLAAEMIKGTDIKDAVRIANYAAGVQVSKVGTSIVYPDEVEEVMYLDGRPLNRKILDYYSDSGLSIIDRKRANGKKVVFTNGCFDILHIGHITYLQEAKKLGDILIVGINSDDSVKHLKGENRPINKLRDRMEMLAALDFVDYVVAFEEETPINLIKLVKPNVLVKGGDYSIENIVGSDFVIGYGGKVEVIPLVEGHSTSGIVKKIQER